MMWYIHWPLDGNTVLVLPMCFFPIGHLDALAFALNVTSD